jgi:transcriptional regulator with XRE-family HTH domain
MDFAQEILRLRHGSKLTQKEIEEKTGIKREYLCRIETGGLPNPTLKTMENLLEAMGYKLAIIPTLGE